MSYTYEYPRPAVTVDCILFSIENLRQEVLLIQRKFPPFKNSWAFPGGFVDMNETLEHAILRELEEETGITKVELNQLQAFSKIDRDPRQRTISVVFYAFVNKEDCRIKAGSDAENVKWFSLKNIPCLAFDHDTVLKTATEKLNIKIVGD
ncbi:MAG: NUDIX hydrolase [Bacteroidales bacterium]|nr:NUDIX hydrolase [Bacteroidales bacterium]